MPRARTIGGVTPKRLFWLVVAAGLALWALGVVDPAYVFAPLLGLAIFRVGVASFASLRNGGSHIPDGAPQRLDTRVERIVYWCDGCGAELLLLTRGAEVPPRHCGERMTRRREVAGSPLN